MKEIVIIGSGFSGLSAACYLAANGYRVQVIEKNEGVGGRASVFSEKGFVFDMGPSWYWMPDVFESFFADFDKKPSDFYELVRLNPSYRVVFENEYIDIPADFNELKNLFESKEPGAAKKLESFMNEAKYKYEIGIRKLVYLPCRNFSEFLDYDLLRGIFKMDVFKSMRRHVRKYFSHKHLVKIMEFPVLFLGGDAGQIPALYSLMNYADTMLGTWYPLGGMGKIPEAMHKLAVSLGVTFSFNNEVKSINVKSNKVFSVNTTQGEIPCDGLICSADYHHVEQNLLPKEYKTYSESYWQKRTMAPSSLLFYVGLNGKLPRLTHHTLFFDEDFDKHIQSIYHTPLWPEKPLFYLSAPSVTDASVAPAGKENLFFLIPIASGLRDISNDRKQDYFEYMAGKIQKLTGADILNKIEFIRSFSVDDFKSRYHAYKGNAYGLANTLLQTAHLKPSMHHKKIKNLFYTGQLTIPGPGVPPALISGKLAAKQIMNAIH